MATELDFLRDYLSTRRSRWSEIAETAHVARRAIAYIVDDVDRDPRHSTVAKLMAWVADNDPKAILAHQGRRPLTAKDAA
jgi:hypothetical protein